MPTTITASGYSPQPRAAHTGVQVLKAEKTYLGASLTLSDIILLGTIPGRCTVVNGYIRGGVKDGSMTIKIGYGAAGGASTDGDILAATTLSATGALTRLSLVPVDVSLSDGVDPYLAQVFATVVTEGTSYSGTTSLVVVLEYAVPGAI